MKKLILLAFHILLFGLAHSQTLSITGFSAGPFESARFYPVTINYSLTGGTFAAGNIFSVELSTSTGGFPGVVVGSVGGNATSGSITTNIFIPSGQTPSTNYRIRLRSSSPSLNSTGNNGSNITISNPANTCTTIPQAPSCPTSGTLTLPNNGAMGGSGTYRIGGTVSGGIRTHTLDVNASISGGGSGVSLYVCANENLVIPADYNPVTNTVIYVLQGGKITINGNMNGAITYIYGDMINTGTSGTSIQVQNNGITYLAPGGVWEATPYTMNIVSGRIVVEGSAKFGTLGQVQSSTKSCIRKNGCVEYTSISNNQFTVDDPFLNDTTGTGFIYYSNNNCPSQTGGRTATASSSIRVCTRQPAGPCAFWGNASVKYNCLPGTGGTSNNCAGAITLPVDLQYYKADISSEGVRLIWGTNRVWNSDFFEIEKSRDGISWETVGVAPAENSLTFKEYAVLDARPEAGGTYYRLSETDRTGYKKQYSVIYVETENHLVDFFNIYPNPASGSFTVNVTGNYKQYELELTDLSGKKLSTYLLAQGPNVLEHSLPSGIYVAKLKVEKDYKVQRLVIE